ncbi:MAG TPA: hypothetical protein VJ904_01425, partial [Tichowtungia sp.]|nr:hypothetical protein [Tichowtungia sp.]
PKPAAEIPTRLLMHWLEQRNWFSRKQEQLYLAEIWRTQRLISTKNSLRPLRLCEESFLSFPGTGTIHAYCGPRLPDIGKKQIATQLPQPSSLYW